MPPLDSFDSSVDRRFSSVLKPFGIRRPPRFAFDNPPPLPHLLFHTQLADTIAQHFHLRQPSLHSHQIHSSPSSGPDRNYCLGDAATRGSKVIAAQKHLLCLSVTRHSADSRFWLANAFLGSLQQRLSHDKHQFLTDPRQSVHFASTALRGTVTRNLGDSRAPCRLRLSGSTIDRQR